MTRSTKLATALLLLLICGVPELPAQQANASVDITATVQARPLGLSVLRGLAFGDLMVGASKSIATTDPGAALVEVMIAPNNTVAISFLLPTVLNASAGQGLQGTMPIDAWTAVLSTDNTTFDGTAFEPTFTGYNASLDVGTFWLLLGATVHAGSNQGPGEYSGTLVVTVSYL